VRLALLAAVALALAAPAAARAAWFPVAPIDGPSPAIVGLGGVAVALDGSGGVVYLRSDGGAPHVFLSRLSGGVWQPPLRLDTGIGAAATAARVAAARRGVLLVAWIAGGVVYGMRVPSARRLGRVVSLGAGATTLDVDIGVDAAGWVVWGGGGDVHAASARGGSWHVLPIPLDMVPAQDAGGPAGPPRVSVGADGSGLMTWAEAGADGRTHVMARRLTPRMSIPPSDLTLPGGSASQPDPALQYDANFGWVAFRQDAGGVPRTVARHYAGSAFDPPVLLAGGAPSLTPRIALSGMYAGGAVESSFDNSVVWSQLRGAGFAAPARLDAGGSVVAPGPVLAVSDAKDVAVAWLAAAPGGLPVVEGRIRPAGQPFQPLTPLSSPARGAVAPGNYDIATDRSGDTAVAVAQGPDGARLIGAAVWDRPPRRPRLREVTEFPRRRRPRLEWSAKQDVWGELTFQVQVDGRVVGTTQATSLVPRRRLQPGRHRWRVVAIDLHGQRARSARAAFRVLRRHR
jgi:hypothetical protein